MTFPHIKDQLPSKKSNHLSKSMLIHNILKKIYLFPDYYGINWVQSRKKNKINDFDGMSQENNYNYSLTDGV